MMAKQFDVKALREKVIQHDDIKFDSVYVPEWDVELPVKTLSSGELKKVMKYRDDQVRMTILAVLHGCKTEDGEKVFEETDLAEFEKNKSFNGVKTVAEKIFEISGLDEGEREVKND